MFVPVILPFNFWLHPFIFVVFAKNCFRVWHAFTYGVTFAQWGTSVMERIASPLSSLSDNPEELSAKRYYWGHDGPTHESYFIKLT